MTIKCDTCANTGWVCEDHHDVPWYGIMPEGAFKCCGGAGMPCLKCNPSDYDNPPRMTPGFKTVLDEDGFHPHVVGGTDKTEQKVDKS